MTGPCLPGCGHEGPPPAAFRLYDVLNCAAQAVDEAASGDRFRAECLWMEACLAGSGLFAPGSEADAAVAVVLEAAGPGPRLDRAGMRARAALWTALDAVATVAFAATGNHHPATEAEARSAESAVLLTEKPLRDALTVILAEVRAMADAGQVTA